MRTIAYVIVPAAQTGMSVAAAGSEGILSGFTLLGIVSVALTLGVGAYCVADEVFLQLTKGGRSEP